MSSVSLQDMQKVPSVVLESALETGQINYRDCAHKQDVVTRVHAHFDALPHHDRGQITDIIKRPTSELLRMEVDQALSSRVARLFPDEQYSVQLFQARAQLPLPVGVSACC